jgi:hypothetical protein
MNWYLHSALNSLEGSNAFIIIFFTHVVNLLTFNSDIEIRISLTAGVSFSQTGAHVEQRLYYC